MNNPRNNPNDPTDSEEDEYTWTDHIIPSVAVFFIIVAIFGMGLATGLQLAGQPCPPAIRGTTT